jgi:hypothetical protein
VPPSSGKKVYSVGQNEYGQPLFADIGMYRPSEQALYLRTEVKSILRNVVLNKKVGRWVISKKSTIVNSRVLLRS